MALSLRTGKTVDQTKSRLGTYLEPGTSASNRLKEKDAVFVAIPTAATPWQWFSAARSGSPSFQSNAAYFWETEESAEPDAESLTSGWTASDEHGRQIPLLSITTQTEKLLEWLRWHYDQFLCLESQLPPDQEATDILNWDNLIPEAPPRPSGRIRVRLRYRGRSEPIPEDDPTVD